MAGRVKWTGEEWTSIAGEGMWLPGEERDLDSKAQVAGHLRIPGFVEVAAEGGSDGGTPEQATGVVPEQQDQAASAQKGGGES